MKACAIGKSPSIKDGNEELYINDDMDAAYLVEEHSELKSKVGTESGIFSGSGKTPKMAIPLQKSGGTERTTATICRDLGMIIRILLRSPSVETLHNWCWRATLVCYAHSLSLSEIYIAIYI